MKYTGGAVLAAFALAVGIIIGQGGEPASAPSPTPDTPTEVVSVPPDDVCVRMRAEGHDVSDAECARYRRNERLVESWSELNRTAPGRIADPQRIRAPDVVE